MLAIHLRIRRELFLPMENMVEYARANYPSSWRGVDSRWLEPHYLQKELMAAQERVRELNKEKTQLSTALDYANNAEENRRLMVSNITHELKTPLAVIHSYAEGLKEGIAADKQEHYLDVILEESERMDAMVLEMLDLSRLEALAKIWDSFYRTDKSRTEKGTGLGLPITKAIMELHGGTCHVSNTKTGVEFKFYLP